VRSFKIDSPATVEEALDILVRDGDDAQVYAGGTELLLALKQGLVACGTLVDIKAIPEIGGIAVNDDEDALDIGALVTHTEVTRSATVQGLLPVMTEVEAIIANVRVRNAGTLVGNLCFAEPHSDVALLSVLLEGRLKLAGAQTGWIAVDDFLVDAYMTALEPGSIVETLRIPRPRADAFFGYSRVKATERPLAAAGVRIDLRDGQTTGARVVVGAVGPAPFHSAEVDHLLTGVARPELDVALRDAAALLARQVDVVDDYDASEEFRRHLAAEMFLRAARRAIASSEGQGDD
jgi:aerobic carbon-monoxide dehydrogenase medium subunit